MKLIRLYCNGIIKSIIGFLFIALLHHSNAQVISTFNFTSTATIMIATAGPNAISVNSNAFVGGGRAKMPSSMSGAGVGMDLVIPGSPHFDVDHIDISLNYEGSSGEGAGNFFLRGGISFGWASNRLIARYRTTDGAGGFTNYTLNTTYNIDNNNPHDYRFTYDDVTGIATIYADGVSVASFDGPNSRPLYWTGAGNAIIGDNIDNNNNASDDKGMLGISISGGNTPLPINFISIEATRKNNQVVILNWSSVELDESGYYNIQKSSDGINFETIYEQINLQTNQGVNNYSINLNETTTSSIFYKVVYMKNNMEETVSQIVSCEPLNNEINIFYNGDKIVVLNPGGIHIKNIQVCDITGKGTSNSIEIESVENQIEINTSLHCTSFVKVVTNTEVISAKLLIY